MTSRTQFLCRLIGLFVLVLAIAEAWQPAVMMEAANQIISAPGLLFVSGGLTLAAGLAIVLSHNVWIRDAPSVVVTLVGWALLIKGAALLLIAPATWVTLLRASHYTSLYALYTAVAALLGLFLAYAGFRVRPGPKAEPNS